MERVDLTQLERKAWQSYHEDGLMETAFGLILVTAFLASIADQYRYVAYVALVLIGPLLAVAKRRITAPRLGAVEFGPGRKARKLRVVVFIATLVAATALLPLLLGGGTWPSDHPTGMGIILGMLVVLAFSAIAYWLQLRRIYVVGVIFAIAFTSSILLDVSLPLLIGGGIVSLFGLWRLFHFIQTNPKASEGTSDDV